MDESGLVESYLAVLVDVKGEIADHIRHATVPLRQTDEEYDQDLVQPRLISDSIVEGADYFGQRGAPAPSPMDGYQDQQRKAASIPKPGEPVDFVMFVVFGFVVVVLSTTSMAHH